MENGMRRKVVAVALIGIAVASFAVANFASALTGKGAGKYQTGVFAKVYGYGEWIMLNTTDWKTLLSLSLPKIPVSAYYHVICDGYAFAYYASVEIAVGVDSPTEDMSTRRFYSFPNIPANPNGIHTERVYYLGPGGHTFYFLGRTSLLGAEGYGNVNYHTITVVVFTDGSLIELPTTPDSAATPYGV